jgi:hypothetical protein
MPKLKQYVNLDAPAIAALTNSFGRTRTIRATPDDRSALQPTDRVEWWCMPVGANNTDQKYLHRNRRVMPREGHYRVTPLTGTTSTGYFQTQVSFPHVGGDHYEVKVCKRDDHRAADKTQTLDDTFETWRKIYYTLYYMGMGSLNFFNSVEARINAAYEECFVELERVQVVPTLTVISKVNTDDNDRFLNGSASAVLNLRPSGTGRLPNHATTKPYHLAMLVAPDIYDTRTHNVNLTRANAVDGVVFTALLWQDPWNTTLVATDCVTRARIRWTGVGWRNVLPSVNLVSNTRGTPIVAARSELRWDLRAVPGLTNYLAGAPGRDYRVQLRIIQERHNFVGYNYRNFCVMETISGVTSALQTFTHEVGHALGQAVRRERLHNAAGNPSGWERNPRWHTDNFGGTGPHCWHNAALTPAPPPAGHTSIYVYGGAGHMCTMYHSDEAHVDPDGKFCPDYCKPRLTRQALDRAQQVAQRWNHYG